MVPFLHASLALLTGLMWPSSVSSPWAVHPQSDGKVPGAWNDGKSHIFFAKEQEECEISEEHQLRRFQEHHGPAAAAHRLWVSQGILSNKKNQGLYQKTFIFPSNQTVQISISFLSVQFTLVLWLHGWHLLSAHLHFGNLLPHPVN